MVSSIDALLEKTAPGENHRAASPAEFPRPVSRGSRWTRQRGQSLPVPLVQPVQPVQHVQLEQAVSTSSTTADLHHSPVQLLQPVSSSSTTAEDLHHSRTSSDLPSASSSGSSAAGLLPLQQHQHQHQYQQQPQLQPEQLATAGNSRFGAILSPAANNNYNNRSPSPAAVRSWAPPEADSSAVSMTTPVKLRPETLGMDDTTPMPLERNLRNTCQQMAPEVVDCNELLPYSPREDLRQQMAPEVVDCDELLPYSPREDLRRTCQQMALVVDCKELLPCSPRESASGEMPGFKLRHAASSERQPAAPFLLPKQPMQTSATPICSDGKLQEQQQPLKPAASATSTETDSRAASTSDNHMGATIMPAPSQRSRQGTAAMTALTLPPPTIPSILATLSARTGVLAGSGADVGAVTRSLRRASSAAELGSAASRVHSNNNNNNNNNTNNNRPTTASITSFSRPPKVPALPLRDIQRVLPRPPPATDRAPGLPRSSCCWSGTCAESKSEAVLVSARRASRSGQRALVLSGGSRHLPGDLHCNNNSGASSARPWDLHCGASSARPWDNQLYGGALGQLWDSSVRPTSTFENSEEALSAPHAPRGGRRSNNNCNNNDNDNNNDNNGQREAVAVCPDTPPLCRPCHAR
ncbi:unnamed protein product [Polarella glacialis]|uniref:Uncharacterized protein n=2 Tax=Polarella glacialis TaxID=89957 RepID=A0A813LAQ9_POLGL|nr:unnamed protein product [Polarella glacialis]